MGRLHDRMAEDLLLRNFSPATQRNYLLYARKFAAFLRERGRCGSRSGSSNADSGWPTAKPLQPGSDWPMYRHDPAILLEREKEVAIGYHGMTMFVKYYAVGPPWGLVC